MKLGLDGVIPFWYVISTLLGGEGEELLIYTFVQKTCNITSKDTDLKGSKMSWGGAAAL